MEYLGFWVTRDIIEPIDKNTSNKKINSSTSQKELRQFIGVANYYRYVWQDVHIC